MMLYGETVPFSYTYTYVVYTAQRAKIHLLQRSIFGATFDYIRNSAHFIAVQHFCMILHFWLVQRTNDDDDELLRVISNKLIELYWLMSFTQKDMLYKIFEILLLAQRHQHSTDLFIYV